ncbi:hypothetical protein HJFPF1_09879 [Paramyrothecium foliicola]|nr:hypothetical protein HJFPF1_09879 [Paramyrothecium foliicola]
MEADSQITLHRIDSYVSRFASAPPGKKKKMRFQSFAILLLGQLAAAQTTTETTSTSTPSAPTGTQTSLPDLVSQIDDCVLGCIKKVAVDINCSATDFECLCATNVENFRSSLQGCVFNDGCSITQALRSAELIDPICQAVRNNPDQEAVASASRLVEEGGAEETQAPDGDDGGSAASNVVANGLLAAVVALLLA